MSFLNVSYACQLQVGSHVAWHEAVHNMFPSPLWLLSASLQPKALDADAILANTGRLGLQHLHKHTFDSTLKV
jgi:hypothetical protein